MRSWTTFDYTMDSRKFSGPHSKNLLHSRLGWENSDVSGMVQFSPGAEINTIRDPVKSDVKIEDLEVRYPSRVHLSPLDGTRFEFGVCSGGGYGYAVDMGNSLRLHHDPGAPQEVEARPHVRHMIEVLRKQLGFTGSVQVGAPADSLVSLHGGLGSTIMLQSALAAGLNHMCGDVLTATECRDLVTANFVEPWAGQVSRGLDTGLGSKLAFVGGICVVANGGVPMYQAALPNGSRVALIRPSVSRPDMDQPESLDMLKRTYWLEERHAPTRCQGVISDLVPSIARGDWDAVRRFVWENQYYGTHTSMIQSYEDGGLSLYECLRRAYSASGGIVGLSSVGPTIAVLSVTGELHLDCPAGTVVHEAPVWNGPMVFGT